MATGSSVTLHDLSVPYLRANYDPFLTVECELATSLYWLEFVQQKLICDENSCKSARTTCSWFDDHACTCLNARLCYEYLSFGVSCMQWCYGYMYVLWLHRSKYTCNPDGLFISCDIM